MKDQKDFAYDVALSFAGEDRPYVAQVASALSAAGVDVFYDEYEAATLWGKDLYVHLRDVYQNQARFTVIFVSEHYAKKVWTNHERESAQARAIQERTEYILPARFDDSEIPGLLHTTGYVDLRSTGPQELADLILAKLGRRPGSWEVTPATPLPGETVPREESLRERAARLSAQHHVRQSREQFLSSVSAVKLAKEEVTEMVEYIQAEVAALKEADPELDIGHRIGNEGVLLVRSPRASFTMHWGQTFSNSLRESRLFTREFDGPHSLDAFGPRRKSIRETHVHFDVDDELRARWRDENSPNIAYTTHQLADRYLSRVVERAYKPFDGTELEDEWEGE